MLWNRLLHCTAGFLCAFYGFLSNFLGTGNTLLTNILAGVDSFTAYVYRFVFSVFSFVAYFASDFLCSLDGCVLSVFSFIDCFASDLLCSLNGCVLCVASFVAY